MRVITFKVDEDLLFKLDVRAQQLRMSRSELIRALIKAYLNSQPKDVIYRKVTLR